MSGDAAAGRAENVTVYLAGLVQGIALVTFPAISTILTAADSYQLSSTQYGMMFLPQVVLAVTTALLGAALARRFDVRRVYLAGLAANLGSMVLLLASRFALPDHAAAYALLLAATACLGAGFGLTTPALNIVGRVLIAVVQRWFPSRLAYHALPILLAGAFGVIACYQFGYGIAALRCRAVAGHRSLRTVFAAAAVVAALMAAVSFAVAGRRASPPSLHPRPVPVGAAH